MKISITEIETSPGESVFRVHYGIWGELFTDCGHMNCATATARGIYLGWQAAREALTKASLDRSVNE
jgi:hypothetical protein